MTKLFPTIFIMVSALSSISFGASPVELRETSFECKKQLCKVKVQFNSDSNLPAYFWEKQGTQLSLYFADLQSALKPGTYKLNSKQDIQIENTTVEGQEVLKLSISAVQAGNSDFSEQLKKSIYELNWKSSNNSKKVWVSKLKPKIKKTPQVTEAPQVEVKKETKKEEKEVVSAKSTPQETKVNTAASTTSEDDLEKFAQRQKNSELNPDKLFGFTSLKQEFIVTKQSILYKSKQLKKKVQDLMPGDIVTGSKVNTSIAMVKSKGVEGFVKLKYLKNSAALTPSENEALKKLALDIIEKKKSTKKPKVNVDETKSEDGVPEVKQNKDTKFYTYSSFGRKDPFIPFEDEIEEGMNIDAVQIVGIIWEETAPIVIMEEVNGSGATYTLKENDPIQNGKVYKITPNEVVFELTEFGITRRFAMQLPNLQEEGSK